MASGDKKRIFLVDDEENMTDLVGTLLGLRGYAVSFSNQPDEAVETILGEDYDAVIVDLMMPRLDGFSLIERLRRDARHVRTPIIVLSGRQLSDSERKRLLTSGAHFLAKPFSPSRFLQFLGETVLR